MVGEFVAAIEEFEFHQNRYANELGIELLNQIHGSSCCAAGGQ